MMVYTTLMLLMFFFHETAHIRAYVRLKQISIIRTKDNVGLSVPVTAFIPNTDTNP